MKINTIGGLEEFIKEIEKILLCPLYGEDRR
jgi:hypothetical protein